MALAYTPDAAPAFDVGADAPRVFARDAIGTGRVKAFMTRANPRVARFKAGDAESRRRPGLRAPRRAPYLLRWPSVSVWVWNRPDLSTK